MLALVLRKREIIVQGEGGHSPQTGSPCTVSQKLGRPLLALPSTSQASRTELPLRVACARGTGHDGSAGYVTPRSATHAHGTHPALSLSFLTWKMGVLRVQG